MQSSGPLVLLLLLALAVASVSFVFMLAPLFAPDACRSVNDALRALVRKPVLFTGVVLLVLYAGSKHVSVRNPGADEGIVLTSITTEYDSTNDVSEVIVSFTEGQVTAATPVSVRPSPDKLWTELVKSNAVLDLELSPHTLTFTVPGNVGTNAYWWVGSDTPAVIIETQGIEIVHFAASSHAVQIAWNCSDPYATEFVIQRRRSVADPWETVGATTSMSFVYTGFTVGETWMWRVISTYEVGGDDD